MRVSRLSERISDDWNGIREHDKGSADDQRENSIWMWTTQWSRKRPEWMDLARIRSLQVDCINQCGRNNKTRILAIHNLTIGISCNTKSPPMICKYIIFVFIFHRQESTWIRPLPSSSTPTYSSWQGEEWWEIILHNFQWDHCWLSAVPESWHWCRLLWLRYHYQNKSANQRWTTITFFK